MIEIRECIDKLASADEAERIYAAEDIGYSNQAEGIAPLLARLSQEPSRAVREAIFSALRQIEDDAVIAGVLPLLDSEDSFVRNQAVEVLQARGAQALPFLKAAFREGNCDRRKFVVDVLLRLTDADTARIYDTALRDSDLNVLITAVETLGSTRRLAFREQIERLVSPDAHPMLLCACLESLAQFGGGASTDVVRARLGPVAEQPGFLRPSYLKLLGAAGTQEDVAEIAELISANGCEAAVLNALTSLRNRHIGLTLPASLARPLRDIVSANQSPVLSYHAMRLLGTLQNIDDVYEFIEDCLRHSDKAVRIGAVQALREVPSEETEGALRQHLAHETDEEVLQAAWSNKSAE